MSWITRIWSWLGGGEYAGMPRRDLNATADFPAPSSLTLVPGSLKLRVGVVSAVGNYREHNEDNFYVPGRHSIDDGGSTGATAEMHASEFEPNNAQVLPVFIVADGMGGQQAGEEASRMAVDIIPRAVLRRLAYDEVDAKAISTAIRDAVAEANQEILGSSGAVSEYSNMGTTVVLALFRGTRVFVAGIGDSRAYRWRGGTIEQLTKDHSLADALVEAGTITREELPNHKFKNILYLYLGSKDARGGPDDVRMLDVQPGDRFLLASDGLTGVVRDDEIAQVLATSETPQQAAKVLKDLALDHDSKDNVTCLVIHAVDGSSAG